VKSAKYRAQIPRHVGCSSEVVLRPKAKEASMPCIRCGKITVKWCTCSIGEAKEAFSAWSEVELRQAINTLKAVLDSKQTEARRGKQQVTESRT